MNSGTYFQVKACDQELLGLKQQVSDSDDLQNPVILNNFHFCRFPKQILMLISSRRLNEHAEPQNPGCWCERRL